MKKALLVFDGTNFSKGAFDFARNLNDIEPILATGVFMPQVDYANLWSYSAAVGSGAGPIYIPLIEEEEGDMIRKNIEHFEELCQKNGIAYRVHKDLFDFALPELKKESRFSDIVILSSEVFYKDVAGGNTFDYLRDALQHSESPVLIVPEHYYFPNNNILAYDGSDESVYAIKQFAYIFPELAKNPTVLVWSESQDEEFPFRTQITELATQHYKDLTLYKLDFIPKKFFATWVNSRKGSILVSGSFGRSAVSQLFKKSFVKEVIIDHRLPVFIAHK